MRKLILLSAALILAGVQPVIAQETAAPAAHAQHEAGQETPEAGWLKRVEAKYVCMMNDMAFDKEQMAVEVGDKTYYGCCSMCKEMLNQDASKRSSIDPVSKRSVDKATAFIGADPHGMTYYFENEENFQTFAKSPMPEMKHEHMEGMDMKDMMHGKSEGTEAAKPAEPSVKPKDHNDHH